MRETDVLPDEPAAPEAPAARPPAEEPPAEASAGPAAEPTAGEAAPEETALEGGPQEPRLADPAAGAAEVLPEEPAAPEAPAAPPPADEPPAEAAAGGGAEPIPGEAAPEETALAGPAAAVAAEEAVPEATAEAAPVVEASEEAVGESALRAVVEAAVYVTEEPVTPAQIATALAQPEDRVRRALEQLSAEYNQPEHGICLREVAGGYKMATKPEHHEAMRAFAKSFKPPLKLSLAALETLATIAYKQPVTAPEIMAIRGVQGAGVLKTLLDRKLIAVAGRKNVVGRPMLYKTTKEFLVQFGLKDLSELPTLKEFEELRRLAVSEDEPAPAAEAAAPPQEETAAPGDTDPQENA